MDARINRQFLLQAEERLVLHPDLRHRGLPQHIWRMKSFSSLKITKLQRRPKDRKKVVVVILLLLYSSDF
jgi:hypothetical protein